MGAADAIAVHRAYATEVGIAIVAAAIVCGSEVAAVVAAANHAAALRAKRGVQFQKAFDSAGRIGSAATATA